MTGPVFSKMPVEAFRDARLSSRDMRILGLLFAFANREGRCWPSRHQLSRLSGLPVSRISTATSRLVVFGWLTKTGNGGRSRACRYQLHTPETVREMVTVTEAVTVTGSGIKTVTEPVTETITHGGKGQGTDHEQTREQTTQKAALQIAEPEVAEYLPQPSPAKSQESDFERFWSAYPRKRNKGAASKAWKVLKPVDALVTEILHALEVARTSDDWRREGGRFIPYPASWLNAHGWEDEHEVNIVPLPESAVRQGESARVAASIEALESLFGGNHGEKDISAGDGVSGGSLRGGALEGTGGRVLGPTRGSA